MDETVAMPTTATEPERPNAVGAETVYQLPFFSLKLSPTNPRRAPNAAADAELVESIKEKGVVQPLIVRPHPEDGKGVYEIVAGSRRYRAAGKADLDGVPCIIRELTDAEAREVQIIENLQREGVSPLEEAQAMKAWLDAMPAGRAKSDQKSRIEQIAKKISKSASYVYQRLKLLALGPAAQKEMEAGRLPAAHAIVIARLPEKAQSVALKECFPDAKQEYTEPDVSVRQLTGRLAYSAAVKRLTDPPFDLKDEKLVSAAGACSACPKLSNNNPELKDFDKNTCTDLECYQGKIKAFIEKECQEASVKGQYLLKISFDERGAKHKLDTDTLYRGEYRQVAFHSCKFTQEAIAVDGWDTGKRFKVCATRTCEKHFQEVKKETSPADREREKQNQEIAKRAASKMLDDLTFRLEDFNDVRFLRYMAIDSAYADYDHFKESETYRSIEALIAKPTKIGQCSDAKLLRKLIIANIVSDYQGPQLCEALKINPSIYEKAAALEIKAEAKKAKTAPVAQPEAKADSKPTVNADSKKPAAKPAAKKKVIKPSPKPVSKHKKR